MSHFLVRYRYGVVAFLALILIALSQQVYLLPLHVAAFGINIALVIVADVHALLWAWGKIPLLPEHRMRVFHYALFYGLSVSIISGLIMFWPLRDYLLTVPAFYAKVGFVLALVVNGVFIERHIGVAASRRFSELSGREKRVLIISGTISAVSWVGAYIMADFLAA